jgi:hypothetical protein
MLYYSLFFKEKMLKQNNNLRIYWKYGPEPAWCLYSKFQKGDESSVCDINLLYSLITSNTSLQEETKWDEYKKPNFLNSYGKRKKDDDDDDDEEDEENDKKKKTKKELDLKRLRKFISKMDDPVLNVILYMLINGSDFTKGYYGITYEKMIFCTRNHRYIGSLILKKDANGDYMLNGASYVKLIKCAYMYSKPLKFVLPKKQKGEDELPDLKIEDCSFDRIKKAVETLSDKNQPPTDKMILSSLLHISFYLEMLNDLGKNQVREPNPLFYAYDKKDAKKEIARKNIIKIFNFDQEQFLKHF